MTGGSAPATTSLASVRRLAATARARSRCAAALALFPLAAAATMPPEQAPTDTTPVDPAAETTVPTTPVETEPDPLDVGESGAATPIPVAGAVGAARRRSPTGVPLRRRRSVVFVGTVGRQGRRHRPLRGASRCGRAAPMATWSGDLVDIRYDNETQYLTVDKTYLVGASWWRRPVADLEGARDQRSCSVATR